MKRPVPDPHWPDEVQEIHRNDLREMWDRNVERHSYNAYQNQLDTYLAIVERYHAQSILDVGCAQGTLALLLGERGKRVTAVDIRPAFLEYARARHERGDVTFIAANVFDAPQLGTFDLVFGNQIIEHLVYPADFLRTLARYAKPGGVVVVTTPNHDYFRASLPAYTELGDPRQHEHKQFSAGGGDHFFAYTEEELRDAARTADLEVEEIFYFETPWISGHFFFRFLHPFAPASALRVLDRTALKLAPRKLAHQLGAVLRKRA
ncbi:MAG TPA: methyltransferase domain-containing protein [Thermoanaerobaculia bacterium]|nr:methyltransferase domain-containing protein [Thermoanaerobaculia bacterium]